MTVAMDVSQDTVQYSDLMLQNKESDRNVLYNDGIRMDLLQGSSLTSQLFQKPLDTFALMDLIITSDIEGNINAINRNTGEVIWTLSGGEPVISVESEDDVDGRYTGKISTPHPLSSTMLHGSIVGNKISDYSNTTVGTKFDTTANQRRKNRVIWIVEPYGDGSLYQFTKENGLQKLPVSIKEFIMNSPFSINDDFVYTGSRHSGIVKINALTGAVVESYGVKFNNEGKIMHDESDDDEDQDEDQFDVDEDVIDDYFTYRMNYHDVANDEEFDNQGTDEGPFITMGRTVYDLTIHAKNSTSWNITYVQWGPNNLHSNLLTQNEISKDNLYIQPFHDKSLLAMDSDAKTVKWVANLPFTTINVFDIFQDADEMGKFVVLPHPIDQSSKSLNRENGGSTYIDKTKYGSWFALSESHYPSLVRSAPIAKYITSKRWRDESVLYNNDLFSISIKGVHDDSIRDKIDKSDSKKDKDVALYDPIRLPTAIEQPTPKRYEKITNEDRRKLPDSAKYYENQHYEKLHDFSAEWENTLKSPTSTYKSSFLKEISIRIFENVIVAMFCVLIVFLLNKFRFINLSNVQQKIEAKIEDVTTSTTLVDEEGSEENNEKTSPKVVTILEPPRSEDDGETEELSNDDNSILKKKRKRGSRAGRKHKRKDATENGEVNGDVSTEEVTKISNSLSITEEILGFGSHGTIVFKGYFENRPVAVKRMLIDFYDVASHEISLLQESDDHSNVIRYFCSQEHNKFLYIALELCSASLEDVVEKRNIQINMDAQQILYQIANGVYHLHSLKIVHRDIKPQNILVVKPRKQDGEVRFLISDFGLCKRLEADQSSFRGTTANAAGTSGWRAPELLIEASRDYTNSETTVRLTRDLDIFSTGCVFYYVLTGGRHPFGDRFSREGEIIKGRYNLDELNHLRDAVEIKDLIKSMIDGDPFKRPNIESVMKHPYFWSTKRKMEFLLKISDRFEIERRDPPSNLLLKFEAVATEVLGKDGWFKKFDKNFIDNLGKYRKYNTHKLMDLLRAVRNKYHHYQDLPSDLLADIGSLDEGFYWFFAKKFPWLLMGIYSNCKPLVGDEPDFKTFYGHN